MDTNVANIKFCGLTRPEDAEHAVALGASYVGVIFAGGPRTVTPDRAREVFRNIPQDVNRVGVFADQDDAEIARVVHAADLSVIQLHGAWNPKRVVMLRGATGCEVWPVVRIEGTNVPEWMDDAFGLAHHTVIDALVPSALGGTGVALPWVQLAPLLTEPRQHGRLVLAGGLKPENVAIAISALRPNVVDVSSGVESSPGIKNHDRMRAFRDAVLSASLSA